MDETNQIEIPFLKTLIPDFWNPDWSVMVLEMRGYLTTSLMKMTGAMLV